MESIEIKIKEASYRIIRNGLDNSMFSVFNHATCHIIKKLDTGNWRAIEHRFGADFIPVTEIGEAIDSYYQSWQIPSGELPGAAVA
jgi:hypothetical protein